MALYENLKDRLTLTGQSAVSKVRDLSETMRLNTEIGDLEQEINNCYAEIGYEIYLAYKDKPIPEVAGLIEQVNELHERIDETKQLIQAMQAAGTCPSCGARVKPEMAFCSNCGFKLPEQVKSHERPAFCSKCGAPISGDDAFCTSCGAELE